jgi:hypothetical protein
MGELIKGLVRLELILSILKYGGEEEKQKLYRRKMVPWTPALPQ